MSRILYLWLPLLLSCAAAAAVAQPAGAPAGGTAGARKLGEFQAWTAATHTENGQKICYAFTRAIRADGVPNRAARGVLLMVTHRPQGRDQVALRPGYNYLRRGDATDPVHVVVGPTDLPFYTAQDAAFARNGRAAVAALRGGREAVARGPGPNGRGEATDVFPLGGFGQALDAIGRECPAVVSGPRR